MNDKIKIGASEYRPPFSEDNSEADDAAWIVDADGKHFRIEAVIDALNELVALRAEVERLRATQQKLAVIAAFFSNTDILFHLTRHAGVTSLREAYSDPSVQAALKEAENDQA